MRKIIEDWKLIPSFLSSSGTPFFDSRPRSKAKDSCVADRMKCTDNVLQKININGSC